MRARSVSGHHSESGQFFEKGKSFNFSPQVRWKCEHAVLGKNLLNMTSVILLNSPSMSPTQVFFSFVSSQLLDKICCLLSIYWREDRNFLTAIAPSILFSCLILSCFCLVLFLEYCLLWSETIQRTSGMQLQLNFKVFRLNISCRGQLEEICVQC